jgi:hypothetical protein
MNEKVKFGDLLVMFEQAFLAGWDMSKKDDGKLTRHEHFELWVKEELRKMEYGDSYL